MINFIKNKQLTFHESSIYWDGLKHLFNAENYGHKGWNVPVYNGGLFSNEADNPFYCNEISNLKITDNYLAPALIKLLVDDSDQIVENGGTQWSQYLHRKPILYVLGPIELLEYW